MHKFSYLLSLFLLLLNCTPKELPAPGGTLRLAYYSSIVGLDPLHDCGFDSSVIIMDLIYAPLYKAPNTPSNILDSVFTEDNRVWFFKIKSGLRFQDDPCFEEGKGREINAHDVHHAFVRSDYNFIGFDYHLFSNIKKITVLDSLHLKFELHNPDPHFVSLLKSPRVRVLPREALEKYGENIRFHPVGNGPFKLASWDEHKVTLIRNQNFWVKSLPYLDTLILYPSKNPFISYNEFQKGKLDVSPIPSSLLSEIVQYNRENQKFRLHTKYAEKGIKLLSGKTINLIYCVLHHIKNPLFRQAVNYAINRNRLVSDRLDLLPAHSPLFKSFSQGFYYDPEKAKSLFIQSGLENRRGFIKPLILEAQPEYLHIATLIKEDLQKIGIDVKIIPTSWIGYQQRRGKEMDIGTFRLLGQDLISQLSIYQEPCFLRINETISTLSCKLSTEFSQKVQEELAKQLETEIIKDPPLIFLLWRENLLISKDYVMNADPDRCGVSVKLWIKK